MALPLRLVGWTLFVLGIGTFFLVGGFTAIRSESSLHRILAWVGMFGALFGMILTSTSRLIAHFATMRRLREQARKRNPFRPPA